MNRSKIYRNFAKMKFTTYSVAIQKMDRLGSRGKAFVFILDFEKQKGFCSELNKIDSHELKFEFPGQSTHSEMKQDFHFSTKPVSYTTYKKAFELVKHNIEHGNTYLLNLTFPSPIETNLSLEEIYHFSKAKFKLFVKDRYVVFSPERFIRIEDQHIFTYPMKGTINAKVEGNDQKLLTDEKENAEHHTIVDLLRNDLSIVSENVRVTRLKYLDKIFTHQGPIWQMSSEIQGVLRKKFQNLYGTLLDNLLPAGSVTGAPKARTVELILAIENYKRKFYTGIFGMYDGKTLDSAVMIRFIEKSGKKFYYKSGGGITFLSEAKKEYEELKSKVYVPIF